MPITMYRRHTGTCRVHELGLPPRAVRKYLDCSCPIWIYGRTDKGAVPRQSTGHTDISAARAIVAMLEARDVDERKHGPLIEECVERYSASRKAEVAPRTLEQIERVLAAWVEWCRHRGMLHIRSVTVDTLEDYKLSMAGAESSKATSFAKLRCFLKHAYRRGWTTEPIIDKVSGYAVAEDSEPTMPFSDEEVDKILGGTEGRFRLLMRLMLDTGMRVSDAIRFDPAKLERGERFWIYTFPPVKQVRTKRKRFVEAYLTTGLKDQLVALGERPFGTYSCAAVVYQRMQRLGKRCGIPDCRPHRLRDTFAIRKLLQGFQLDDVSRLLGHSSVQVTEKHYAAWIPARTRRLERLLAESGMDA